MKKPLWNPPVPSFQGATPFAIRRIPMRPDDPKEVALCIEVDAMEKAALVAEEAYRKDVIGGFRARNEAVARQESAFRRLTAYRVDRWKAENEAVALSLTPAGVAQ